MRETVTPDHVRLGIVITLVLTALIATAATFFGTQRLFETQAVSVARSQHALYLRSLNQAIKQHQHLPFVLSQNQSLVENVTRGKGQQLNDILHSFAGAAELEAIYIMSLQGKVIAASNTAGADSFFGQNYAFRPYFRAAVKGTRSDYFAIGVTTGRPGYFVAEPLFSNSGDVVAVIAIKLDVSGLQASWVERGENVLVTNDDGIVVLSSNPAWLYRTIKKVDEPRKAEILSSRQFAQETLAPLAWNKAAGGEVVVQDIPYIRIAGTTDLLDWTVHYLTAKSLIRRQTLLATGVLGSMITVLIGFAAFLRSRRIAAVLAVSQLHRKELIKTNAQLRKAQDDLSRASKLAALGQLAASVTHELGQPISALKNHLLAAEIGNEITSIETRDNLNRLTSRMEMITQKLRFFAQKRSEIADPTDIVVVLNEAMALLQHDFDAAQIELSITPAQTSCIVDGDQLQLEQAMINLLRNALQASSEAGGHAVRVVVQKASADITIKIVDTGPGLNDLTFDALKEPFFSTKSSGVGMGLGLAITSEIVRAHGGTLTAKDANEGGAEFTLTLPESVR